MTSIERTAYPRFGSVVTARDLTALSPSPDEVAWARDLTRSNAHLLALVTSLKCFQRLGMADPASRWLTIPDMNSELLDALTRLEEVVLQLQAYDDNDELAAEGPGLGLGQPDRPDLRPTGPMNRRSKTSQAAVPFSWGAGATGLPGGASADHRTSRP